MNVHLLELSMAGFAPAVASALAYLDPGTGSYALQVLLAAFFGGMFALKQSWGEMRAWFASRFGGLSRPGPGR